jgi:hypothetical protein
MSNQISGWIIVGQVEGQKQAFRPSDWAHRLSELDSELQENGIPKYSEYLYPIEYLGTRSLYIDFNLKLDKPEVFNQIISFAVLHKLRTIEHDEAVIPFHCILKLNTGIQGAVESQYNKGSRLA